MVTENKNSRAPFFIVGVQRSGTTLLSVLLEKHPDVFMEKKAITFRIITCFNNLYDLLPFNVQHNKKKFTAWLIKNDVQGHLAKLLDYQNIEKYDNLRSLIQGSIQKKIEKENKLVWGDKCPNLQHFMNDLMLMIPNAKILHVVRDGRANAYSTSNRSYRHLSLSAQQWVDGNIFGIVNQQILGEHQYKQIKFEDLLRQPEKEAKAICEFLEIPFATEMLDLADDKLKREKSYVKSFFDQKKIDNWKEQLTDKQVEQVENIQGPLLKDLGYDLQTNPNRLDFKTLSLRRKIWYNQRDNFKQLFRSKKIGMRNKEMIDMDISLKSRVFTFLRLLTQDVFSLPIFKVLFSRVFYTKKIYDESTNIKDEQAS